MIDKLKVIFETNDIEYWTKGVNVGKNEINIECPYCNDTHNHLGISKRGGFRCLKCESSGWIGNVLDLLGIDQSLLKTKLKPKDLIEKERKRLQTDNLVKHATEKYGITDKIPSTVYEYLAKRKINPTRIIKEKNLFWGGKTGWFKYRIVFPVKDHAGRVVSLSGRDITGTADVKYKHLPEDKSILTPKEVLYGAECLKTKENVLLVEGIFDQHPFNHYAAAISGKTIHEKQISTLLDLQVKSCLVLLDPGEEETSEKIADEINQYIPTKRLEVDINRDPGEFTKSEVKQIIQIVKGEAT